MRFVLEMDLRLFELAEALHEAFFVGVDQDVVDGRILEQRLDRPESYHLVDDFFRECRCSLWLRDSRSFQIFAHIGTNLMDQVLARQLLQGGEIELIDDPRVQLELLVESRRPLRNQFVIVLRGRGRAHAHSSRAPCSGMRVQVVTFKKKFIFISYYCYSIYALRRRSVQNVDTGDNHISGSEAGPDFIRGSSQLTWPAPI